MDTSIATNDEQQLIQMSALSPEENPVIMRETINLNNNEIKEQTKAEIKQQTFVLRLFSWPIRILTSIHIPHFSDHGLRVTFLLFITLIGLTSFTSALIIGSSVVQFKQQCPLYASFKFESVTKLDNNYTVRLVQNSERFSPPSTCDFCTFYNVFTFIYCIMTGFFFVLFNGDQRIVKSNDRCLIIPWFPISITLGLLGLINASILTNGFLKFCSSITSHDSRIDSCTLLNRIFFEQYPNVSSFFIYMLIAIIGSWIQLAFFIGVIAILLIRLGSSFDWSNNNNNKHLNGKPINIIMQSIEKP
ncbi:unnamed protein product [Adineta steineri]|uniref:Uncharacterized protein n=1 Tax=Adineta steineri TaxID=433720 RepID=A0A814VSC3_9BILA|nr:unnamed protein product [Adineta steineri]CAF1189333.1 unnamed protein product [Adineta steineri]